MQGLYRKGEKKLTQCKCNIVTEAGKQEANMPKLCVLYNFQKDLWEAHFVHPQCLPAIIYPIDFRALYLGCYCVEH